MHKVISRISSGIFPDFSSAQPKGPAAMVKRAMCHIRLAGLFLAILACLSILYVPGAQAQAAGSIEQNFANSLTAVPADTLAVSGAFYVPVYSSVSMSQGRLRA